MKRKLKVKKTVVRSLSGTVRVSGAGWGGWNCNSAYQSCAAPCAVDTHQTCPVTHCYCNPHTWHENNCEGQKFAYLYRPEL